MSMRTKEQTEEIATLAGTTPEIVEAVLSAYYQARYTLIEACSVNKGKLLPSKDSPPAISSPNRKKKSCLP